MNPERKSYAAVSACEAVIRSIERGVLDREMREHITKLREQMAQLEHGRPIDVCASTADRGGSAMACLLRLACR